MKQIRMRKIRNSKGRKDYISDDCFALFEFDLLSHNKSVKLWSLWIDWGERQSLRSIGFRRLTWKEGLLALSLGIFLFLPVLMWVIFIERVVSISARVMDVVEALAQFPIWLRILLAARAGFVEEILYRGYPIERLNRLKGTIWPGALISLIIFVVFHLRAYSRTGSSDWCYPDRAVCVEA